MVDFVNDGTSCIAKGINMNEIEKKYEDMRLNEICLTRCPIVDGCPEMHECKARKRMRRAIRLGVNALENVSCNDSYE